MIMKQSEDKLSSLFSGFNSECGLSRFKFMFSQNEDEHVGSCAEIPRPHMCRILIKEGGLAVKKGGSEGHLTEEALAYFDECVSLKTFEFSDFAPQEVPPVNLGATHISDPALFSQAGPNVSADPPAVPFMTSGCAASRLIATSCKELIRQSQFKQLRSTIESKCQFSFAHNPNGMVEHQQYIKNYVKNFEKDIEKVEMNMRIVESKHYDSDEHKLQASQQRFLFDRVFFKNRNEFGVYYYVVEA